MTPRPCCELDAFLGGWLEFERRAEFEGHLRNCAGCRRAVESDRGLTGLLRQGVAGERPSTVFLARLERAIDRQGRWLRVGRHLAALASAAAAVAIVWCAWPRAVEEVRAPSVAEAPVPAMRRLSVPLARVQVDEDAGVILDAVPLRTEQMTIYFVYEGVSVAQRGREARDAGPDE